MPATALWTLVPMAPGGLGGRGGLAAFGTLGFGGLGAFGGLLRLGLRERLRDGTPTREVGMGTGEGERDSHSDSGKSGESGFGGGKTSPGIIVFFCR